MADPRRLAVLAVGAVPFAVVVADGTPSLVFAVGLVDPAALTVTTPFGYLYAYTRGLPQHLLSWPVASLAYAIALGNVVLGAVRGAEDRRVTAVALLVAGGAVLVFAVGQSRGLRTLAVPVGTVTCWTVAWWFDWPALMWG